MKKSLLRHVPKSYREDKEVIEFIKANEKEINEEELQLIKKIWKTFDLDYKALLKKCGIIHFTVTSPFKVDFLKKVAKNKIKTIDDLMFYGQNAIFFDDAKDLEDFMLETFNHRKYPGGGYHILFIKDEYD